MTRKSLTVFISLDVEEEGLFSGRYECLNPSISNTAALARLAPLLDRGVKPTMFCAYSAFADAPSRTILEKLRDRHGAEIGAHLHHWNTPPLENSKLSALSRVPAAELPPDLLNKKIASLFQIARDFQGAPVASFRMGRWDLDFRLWPLLAEHDIKCDASVRPLHCAVYPENGPNHFDAPADPYRIKCGDKTILEVPLTVIPILPLMAKIPASQSAARLRSSLKYWGALALLPVQHPLWLMKLTAAMHASRGGKALSLTWHSSEMMPGGAPHMPDKARVDLFMGKIFAFLDWLEQKYNVTYETMGGVASDMAPFIENGLGDWIWKRSETVGGE